MSRVLKFRAFFNGQMSSPFHLGEGVCWPDGRVSTANKVGEVMQFTGLLDMDSVDIYEKDILEGFCGNKRIVAVMDWVDGEGRYSTIYPLSKFRVIGNVFQNRDLLLLEQQ